MASVSTVADGPAPIPRSGPTPGSVHHEWRPPAGTLGYRPGGGPRGPGHPALPYHRDPSWMGVDRISPRVAGAPRHETHTLLMPALACYGPVGYTLPGIGGWAGLRA